MKLMVLDGNSIINRAFYGVRPLTTREGLHTNALFGFVNILQRFLDGEQPDAVCVAFDRHEPTFRHEADEQYKANRHGMPEELHQQMPILKDILAAMHIPCYDMAGYEADDLIGTISRRCEAANWDCVIVTGDRDALQLITDHTRVMLVSSKAGQTVTRDMNPVSFRQYPRRCRHRRKDRHRPYLPLRDHRQALRRPPPHRGKARRHQQADSRGTRRPPLLLPRHHRHRRPLGLPPRGRIM